MSNMLNYEIPSPDGEGVVIDLVEAWRDNTKHNLDQIPDWIVFNVEMTLIQTMGYANITSVQIAAIAVAQADLNVTMLMRV